MSQKTTLINFVKALYDSDDITGLPSKKKILMFISEYSEDQSISTRKNSGGRTSTKPGACFDNNLCRCRVFNRGEAKQCSSKKVNGEYCKMHFAKIDEFGGWSYGHYDEDRPTQILYDGNKVEKGDAINWKDMKKLKKTKPELPQEIQDLKNEYEQKLGKKPKGPKANDPKWLKSKIEADDSGSEPEMDQIQELKDEYEKLLNKRPKGPKASDIEWLKAKIAKANSETENKVELDANASEFIPSESEDEEGAGVGLLVIDDKLLDKTPIKFKYEGVEYTRTLNDKGDWTVEDEDENIIGEWVEGHHSGWINWEDACWEEIHKDHEDYSEE